MSNIIELPSIGGYHFGYMDDVKKFIENYFEEINSTTNIINKAIILSIEYKSNEIYNRTDGYAGNCWIANILDSRQINGISFITYSFRNFRDLVAHYEKEGFKFI
jgi:hypothetical protein